MAAHLVVLAVPFGGAAVAVILLWNRAVATLDLALLAAMYLLVAPGITPRPATSEIVVVVPASRRLTHESDGSSASSIGCPRLADGGSTPSPGGRRKSARLLMSSGKATCSGRSLSRSAKVSTAVG